MDDLDFQIERVLTFKHSGEVKHGKVKIGGMKFLPDEQKWACRLAIDYLLPETAWVHGEDKLDAIRHCFFISSESILTATEKGWSIWWQKEGDHGGFVDYT